MAAKAEFRRVQLANSAWANCSVIRRSASPTERAKTNFSCERCAKLEQFEKRRSDWSRALPKTRTKNGRAKKGSVRTESGRIIFVHFLCLSPSHDLYSRIRPILNFELNQEIVWLEK